MDYYISYDNYNVMKYLNSEYSTFTTYQSMFETAYLYYPPFYEQSVSKIKNYVSGLLVIIRCILNIVLRFLCYFVGGY